MNCTAPDFAPESLLKQRLYIRFVIDDKNMSHEELEL